MRASHVLSGEIYGHSSRSYRRASYSSYYLSTLPSHYHREGVLPPHTLSLNSQLPSATVLPLRESFPVIGSNVDPLNVLRAFFAALAAVFLPPSFPVQFFLFVGVALPPQ